MKSDTDVCITEVEDRKLHHHVQQRSNRKCLALINRVASEESSDDTKSTSDNIRHTDEVQKRHARGPPPFRVSIPDDQYTYNRIISKDLIVLDG